MTSPQPVTEGRSPQAVVFDFGGVLFRWQPLVLIQQVLPHLAGSDEQARDLAAQVFQSFAPGSDWAEFDRGTLPWDAVRERIVQRTGLRADDVRPARSCSFCQTCRRLTPNTCNASTPS